MDLGPTYSPAHATWVHRHMFTDESTHIQHMSGDMLTNMSVMSSGHGGSHMSPDESTHIIDTCVDMSIMSSGHVRHDLTDGPEIIRSVRVLS